MTDKEIAEAINNAVVPILRALNTKERKFECASYVLALGYELTRGLEHKEFLHGWLDAARADLDEDHPRIVIVEHH